MDGSFIIYCAVSDDAGPDVSSQLFLRELGKLDAEPIPGTEGGIAPFLSPDDRWIGFWADRKFWKVPVEGGVPQALGEAPRPYGASWGDDDMIVFAGMYNTGLCSVPSQGGKLEILTNPDPEKGEDSHRLPSHLPKGKGILFTIMTHSWDIEPRIAILEGTSRKWRTLLEDASDALYIPTGHLVFLRRGTLTAVAFDMEKLQIYGQPVPVIPNMMHMLNSISGDYNTEAGQYCISESGTLAYVPGGILPDRKNSLVWVDKKGNETPLSSHVKHYLSLRLSPDGEKIVVRTLGTENYIWVHDIGRDISIPVISEGRVGYPIWTPDGNNIIFGWMSSIPPENIYNISADGSMAMEHLIISKYRLCPSSVSPDGNLLAFVELRDSHGTLIYDFRTKSITEFIVTEHEEMYPEFSPDGRWIAYCTQREGQYEVYVRPSSGTGQAIKVSREGGREPLWARSGEQLFYRSLDFRQMWVVDIKAGAGLTVEKPHLLFEKSGLGAASPVRSYDISLDDQRFLMVRQGEIKPQPVTEMTLIQNWFEELKRFVPTGK